MSNLLQTNRTAIHTPSDATNAPFPFQGLLIPANAAATDLVVVNLVTVNGVVTSETTTFAAGVLTAGVVYPIPGIRVNDTGTTTTSVVIFGG